MSAANESHPAGQRKTDGVRLRFPLAVIVLAGGGIAYLNYVAELTRGYDFFGTVGIGFLGVVAVLVWLAFFSGASVITRVLGVFLPVIIIGTAVAGSRFDEFDGDSIPVWSSWTWRWAPKPHEQLSALTLGSGSADVELTPATNDFPQFLGSNRDGIVDGIKLARDWKKHPPREVWRRPIGAGWSGFAVVGDYAFTQEQRGDKEIVSCYRLKTGQPAWVHEDDTSSYRSRFSEGDGPRATPTVVDGRVYTMGGAGLLNCLDAATGKRIWSHDVLKDFQAENTAWGKSCSPLVLESVVVVTGGGGVGPSLIAYDKDSGDRAWAAVWGRHEEEHGTISDSYASPMLATLHGVPQILNLEDRGVAAYDAETGEQLWRHNWPWHGGFGHPKCSQPTVLPGNRIFISSGYTSGCSVFRVLRDSAGGFGTREVWKSESLKTKFSNAVRRGDYLYGLHDRFLRCIGYSEGRVLWKGRKRYGHGQILLVDDLILVQAERPGDVALVEATPEELREVGRIKALTHTTWNTLALSGKYLLVRNDREAVCFELALAEE